MVLGIIAVTSKEVYASRTIRRSGMHGQVGFEQRELLPKTIFYIYIRKSKHNLGLECHLPYLLTYVLYAFHARRRVISLDFAPSLRHVVKSPFVRWSLNRLRTVLFSCFTDQMNELLEFIIHSLAFERRDPRTVT
jgi:hypothetical protein